MKRTLFPVTLAVLMLALVLVACGTKTSTTASTNLSTSSNTASGGSNANQSLSQAAQLLVGTLKLEGTTNAVNAAEAASLLPLWQAYSQLINSDTAAQAEIDAVLAQIQQTMTKDQVQAITAMKLTRQDEFSVMGSLGLAPSNGTAGASGTPNASSAAGDSGGFDGGAGAPLIVGGAPAGGAPAGGAPAGGAPSGGSNPGGGGLVVIGGNQPGFTGTQVATPQTARVRSGEISPALLNALIELLQKRAGS